MSGERRIIVGRITQDKNVRGRALVETLSRELKDEMNDGAGKKKAYGKSRNKKS